MDCVVHGVTKSRKPLSLSWGKGPDLIGVGRGILLRALSISRCSFCVSHDCESLIALHSGHYSGLLWQWATLRKEVMTFLGQRGDLPLLAIKMVKHPSSDFFSYNNPLHIQGPSRNTCIVPLGPGGQLSVNIMLTLWLLHALWVIKSFVSDLVVCLVSSCQPPWNCCRGVC